MEVAPPRGTLARYSVSLGRHRCMGAPNAVAPPRRRLRLASCLRAGACSESLTAPCHGANRPYQRLGVSELRVWGLMFLARLGGLWRSKGCNNLISDPPIGAGYSMRGAQASAGHGVLHPYGGSRGSGPSVQWLGPGTPRHLRPPGSPRPCPAAARRPLTADDAQSGAGGVA